MQQDDRLARVKRAFNVLLRRQGNSGPLTAKRAFLKWIVLTRTRSLVIPVLQKLVLNARVTPSKALNILMMVSGRDPNEVMIETLQQIFADRLQETFVLIGTAATASFPVRLLMRATNNKLTYCWNILRNNRDHLAGNRGFEILEKVLELQPKTAKGSALRKITLESARVLSARNMSAVRLANHVVTVRRNLLKDSFSQIVRVTDRRILLASSLLAALQKFAHERRFRPAMTKIRLYVASKQQKAASFARIMESMLDRQRGLSLQQSMRGLQHYATLKTRLGRALILPTWAKVSMALQRMINFCHIVRDKQKSFASAVEILAWCAKKRLTIGFTKLRNSTTRFKILLGKLVRWRRWRALMKLAKVANAWKVMAATNRNKRNKAFKKLTALFCEKKRQVFVRVSREQLQQQYRRSFSSEWAKRWEHKLQRVSTKQALMVKQVVSKKLSASRAFGILFRQFGIQQRIGFLSVKHYGEFRKLLAIRAQERAFLTHQQSAAQQTPKKEPNHSNFKTIRLVYYARLHRVLSGIILSKQQQALENLKQFGGKEQVKDNASRLRGSFFRSFVTGSPSFVLQTHTTTVRQSAGGMSRQTSAPYLQFAQHRPPKQTKRTSRPTDFSQRYEGALKQLAERSGSETGKPASTNFNSTANSMFRTASKGRESLLLDTFTAESWAHPRRTSSSFLRSKFICTDRVRIDLSPGNYGRSVLLPSGH